MKSLKRKVLLMGIVLAFALIASFGTTYAWFTISNTVTVNTLTLNVKSSENLLIRVYNAETVSDLSEYFFYSGTVGESDLSNLSGDTVYDYVSSNLWQIVTFTTVPVHWTLGGRNYSFVSGHLVETDVPDYVVISTVYDDSVSAEAARDVNGYFYYSGTVGASNLVNLSASVTYVFDTDHWTLGATDYVLGSGGDLVEEATPANVAISVEKICDDSMDAQYYSGLNLFYYSSTVGSSDIVNLSGTKTYIYVAADTVDETVDYEIDGSGNMAEVDDPYTVVVPVASIYETEAMALSASTAVNTAASSLLLDATNYYYQLQTSNITAAALAGYDDLSSWTIGPVTALQAVSGYSGKTVYGALDAKNLNAINVLNKNLSLTTLANQTDGAYIELKFWVLSQSTTDEDIVLSNLTIEANNTLEAQDAIVSALRVAVWKQADAVLNGGSISGLSTEETGSRIYSVGIDGPDYNFAFASGMLGYVGNYDDPETPNLESEADPAKDYIVNASGFNSQHALFYSTTPVSGVSATLASSTTITTLSPNTPALITVRIYVEGWDAQASNALLDSQFTISFGFQLKDSSL